MKVWITQDIYLQRQFRSDAKLIPAGTCLFIANDQLWNPDHTIAVYGSGVYDFVSIDLLSSEPQMELV
jgi:hypothetical protein